MCNQKSNHLKHQLPLPDKADFPIFERYPRLTYLDSAATSQKPRCVIDAISGCYEHSCAPIHRGLYDLAASASEQYEQARDDVAGFINAPNAQDCIFTRSATEAINLVAFGWAQPRLKEIDEIWVSDMEHHANYLPWQRVCKETGASLRSIPVSTQGELQIDDNLLFSSKVKLIALTHVSNVLGCINPIAKITEKAKQAGIPVLVDACQAVGHIPVDVQQLDCAFLAFSGHKMYGPEGIGVLYGKQVFLEQCEPMLLGGGMVDTVSVSESHGKRNSGSRWAALPAKLEAGSPHLSGAVGLSAAINYVKGIGVHTLHEHSSKLAQQARAALDSLDGVTVLGPQTTRDQLLNENVGIVSFVLDGVHPHDVAQIAADNELAMRAGHHCAQPLMHALKLDSTLRISFGAYNNEDDIAVVLAALKNAQVVFKQ